MMTLRHQDYQLTLPEIPVGGLEGVPLQLESDAPFLLRLVKSRSPSGHFPWRFQNAKKQWQSSALRTENPEPGAAIDPQMFYPVNGQIVCDIGNETGGTITNGRLLFRGSKVFQEGAISAPTYPARMSVLPFTYQVGVSQVVGGTATGTFASFGVGRLNNQLRVRSDADFALRYGVCDPFTLGVEGGPVRGAPVPSFSLPGATFTDVWVMLRDESRKAYSNEPIHVDDLFGRGTSSINSSEVRFLPGTFQPEIYIERDHSLYFDVFRSDLAAADPVDLWFRFQGAKVFQR